MIVRIYGAEETKAYDHQLKHLNISKGRWKIYIREELYFVFYLFVIKGYVYKIDISMQL